MATEQASSFTLVRQKFCLPGQSDRMNILRADKTSEVLQAVGNHVTLS